MSCSSWLAGHGVVHVALESTGVFWRPVFNLLEARFTLLRQRATQANRLQKVLEDANIKLAGVATDILGPRAWP